MSSRPSPMAQSRIPAMAAAAANSHMRFQPAAQCSPAVAEAASAMTMQASSPALVSSAARATCRCRIPKASAHPISRPCACQSGLKTATVMAPLRSVTVATAACAQVADPMASTVRMIKEARRPARTKSGSNSGQSQ